MWIIDYVEIACHYVVVMLVDVFLWVFSAVTNGVFVRVLVDAGRRVVQNCLLPVEGLTVLYACAPFDDVVLVLVLYV